MVIRNILFVPVYWYKLCYHARHVEKYTEEEHYELLRYIDHRANTSGNINIKVYGQENIPDDNGFMFYPNHQGLYDVLAIMEACPRPFSVVAKKEVANVPFLKQVFACMKAYMIDREDVRQSLQVIINVSNDVKAGKNFLIFPEGTRSKKGNQVQEFKGGSFKAATRAKCPIVPVALVNCFVPFDSKTTEQVDVQVHFLKPLLYDEYKDKGFEILDFPCNQFFQQAPGSDAELSSFCKLTYGTTFETFAKIEVNGENASDLYKFLKSEAPQAEEDEESKLLYGKLEDLGFKTDGEDIKWNFTKFLVDKNGKIISRFAPTYEPEKLASIINDLLK